MRRSEDPCPRCGEEVILVDPAEPEWSLDTPATGLRGLNVEYEEDVEAWLCVSCGWNEEATDEESVAEATANLEWVMGRLAELT